MVVGQQQLLRIGHRHSHFLEERAKWENLERWRLVSFIGRYQEDKLLESLDGFPSASTDVHCDPTYEDIVDLYKSIPFTEPTHVIGTRLGVLEILENIFSYVDDRGKIRYSIKETL